MSEQELNSNDVDYFAIEKLASSVSRLELALKRRGEAILNLTASIEKLKEARRSYFKTVTVEAPPHD